MRLNSNTLTETNLVIPAKAGIHHPPLKFLRQVMDPRLTCGQFILSARPAGSRRAGVTSLEKQRCC
jgi:hypothetical protein